MNFQQKTIFVRRNMIRKPPISSDWSLNNFRKIILETIPFLSAIQFWTSHNKFQFTKIYFRIGKSSRNTKTKYLIDSPDLTGLFIIKLRQYLYVRSRVDAAPCIRIKQTRENYLCKHSFIHSPRWAKRFSIIEFIIARLLRVIFFCWWYWIERKPNI